MGVWGTLKPLSRQDWVGGTLIPWPGVETARNTTELKGLCQAGSSQCHGAFTVPVLAWGGHGHAVLPSHCPLQLPAPGTTWLFILLSISALPITISHHLLFQVINFFPFQFLKV